MKVYLNIDVYLRIYSFLSIIQGILSTQQLVSCGSTVKLMNSAYKIRLHSHDVKYGSGSGQQSVTGVETKEDVNSHWVVKGLPNKPCTRGRSVGCGDKLRLEHLVTHRNLHSHLFGSPLSGGQEVSAFGEEGEGDTGDYWTVVCSGESWRRDDFVTFRHVDTDMYLSVSGRTYGRPIHGQMEVCAVNSPDSASKWQVQEGVFMMPTDESFLEKRQHTEHDEL